jgi:ArsR family transcriptional regulator
MSLTPLAILNISIIIERTGIQQLLTKVAKTERAIRALGALAQEHRLALFRLLVQAGQQGMSAGAIAGALGVPNSSLSFHLAALTKAGLIRQERQSRSLVYSADYAAMNDLVGYLTENCCGGADCSTSAFEASPAEAESPVE